MKASQKQILQKAEELGISTDELLEEMKVGTPDKQFTVAISFSRFSELKEFVDAVGRIGVGVYKADVLDPEFGGAPRKNSFVIRTIATTSKPEEWRVA
jgi:hypothetical protein